jgi:AraC-like DNA-binding protein
VTETIDVGKKRKMAVGRLRHYIKGKFKKIPELNCLMSSADSSWSGLLIERQKYHAGRVSESVCVYNPRLLVVKRGEITCSWRERGRRHTDRRKPGTVIFINRGFQLDDVEFDASMQSGLSTPKLRRLVDYILANLDSDLARHDLDLVDLSPHHLCRSFKRATGTSPYQYILKERIERSKALLRMGNTSVAQVALSVGFSSQSHFAVAFRKHTGTTPGRFLRHSSL